MIRPARQNWVLVFDLDDTLYPEADFVASGFAAVDQELGKRGILGFASLASELFQQGSRGKIFDAALEKLGVQTRPELIAELVQVYRSHPPQLTLFSDAKWALGHYAEKTKIALLTDGYAATQRNKVKALGLDHTFAATLYTDDFGREGWKPSPAPFQRLAAMLKMGDSTAPLVYVADNPAKDFIAPNELGWTTVRVRRPDGQYTALQPQQSSHAAHYEIQTLDELPRILE